MSLINSKNIKRLMLLIISLLTAMLSNIASNYLLTSINVLQNHENTCKD